MKIILEGTEAELRSALHSFGVPDKTVSDNGSQFLCSDIAGKGNRRKTAERNFAEFKAIAQNRLNDFCGNDKTERPQRVELNLNFMSDPDSPEIKALVKEHAERCRQVCNSTPHVNRISNIVREYSKRYSESLQGNLSDQVVKKISSIMALFADASLAEATEVTEHVKNIVLNELPKYTEVTL